MIKTLMCLRIWINRGEKNDKNVFVEVEEKARAKESTD